MSRMNPAPRLLSLDKAISWVVASASRLPAETTPLLSACHRVLAEEIRLTHPIPITDRAARDGFAVAASDTVGATSYNPLVLPLRSILAGDPIPPGCDAVIPLNLGQPQPPDAVECVEALAPGENVEALGSVAVQGALLSTAGTQLSPPHIGVLTAAGFVSVKVIRRPMVRIVVAPGSARPDSNGPMTRALAERDGGVVADVVTVERSRQGIRSAVGAAGVDVVLVIGGTGPGADDHAADALSEAGELAIHGVAFRPGETSGLGRAENGAPVMLLPGSPAACLFSYEMLAGRVVRRLGGLSQALPYRSRVMRTARKIVSAIGIAEICPVRCSGLDIAEPLPSFSEAGLMAVVAADGFVIVPAASEGHPQGASVTVYLYEGVASTANKR
jgi:molybdopterin molybdotransferase